MSGEGSLKDRWLRLVANEQLDQQQNARLDALEASSGDDVSATDDGIERVGSSLRIDIDSLPLAPGS